MTPFHGYNKTFVTQTKNLIARKRSGRTNATWPRIGPSLCHTSLTTDSSHEKNRTQRVSGYRIAIVSYRYVAPIPKTSSDKNCELLSRDRELLSHDRELDEIET